MGKASKYVRPAAYLAIEKASLLCMDAWMHPLALALAWSFYF